MRTEHPSTFSDLPPEARLLMALAMARLSVPARAAADALLDGAIDWDRFARFSVRHALAPLMHRHLGEDARVPAPVRAGLRRTAEAAALQNMRMMGELLLLCRAFDRAGVPLINIKGPVLAERIDGETGLRMISDIDLLVQPERAGDAAAILTERGYRDVRDYAFSKVDSGWVRPSDGMYLELHRRLNPPWLPFRLPMDKIWRNPARHSMRGGAVPGLPLEDELLYLAFHGGKHGWSRLAWLTGFVGLLLKDAPSLDPARLAVRAADLKLQAAVGSALVIVRDGLLVNGLPPELMHLCTHPAARNFTAIALDMGFAEEPGEHREAPAERLLSVAAAAIHPSGGNAAQLARETFDRDTVLRIPSGPQALRSDAIYSALGGRKWRYRARQLFAPSMADVARFGVPARHWWFYAAARPLHVAGKGLGHLASRVRRRLAR